MINHGDAMINNRKITYCFQIQHNKMDNTKVQQKVIPICELNKSNKNISITSVVSCLDDNINYTYANSCKGGKYIPNYCLIILANLVIKISNIYFKCYI